MVCAAATNPPHHCHHGQYHLHHRYLLECSNTRTTSQHIRFIDLFIRDEQGAKYWSNSLQICPIPCALCITFITFAGFFVFRETYVEFIGGILYWRKLPLFGPNDQLKPSNRLASMTWLWNWGSFLLQTVAMAAIAATKNFYIWSKNAELQNVTDKNICRLGKKVW